MFRVIQLTSLQELVKLWPRLLKLAQTDCVGVDPTHFLQLALRCLQSGAVFIVRGDSGVMGSCLVEHGSDFILVLHSIPNDKGTGIAKACLAAVKLWAKQNLYEQIQVSTSKLSGSSYRYFEKTLGFRRNTVTFKLKLN